MATQECATLFLFREGIRPPAWGTLSEEEIQMRVDALGPHLIWLELELKTLQKALSMLEPLLASCPEPQMLPSGRAAPLPASAPALPLPAVNPARRLLSLTPQTPLPASASNTSPAALAPLASNRGLPLRQTMLYHWVDRMCATIASNKVTLNMHHHAISSLAGLLSQQYEDGAVRGPWRARTDSIKTHYSKYQSLETKFHETVALASRALDDECLISTSYALQKSLPKLVTPSVVMRQVDLADWQRKKDVREVVELWAGIQDHAQGTKENHVALQRLIAVSKEIRARMERIAVQRLRLGLSLNVVS